MKHWQSTLCAQHPVSHPLHKKKTMLTCFHAKVVFVTLLLWNVVLLVGLWTNIRNPFTVLFAHFPRAFLSMWVAEWKQVGSIVKAVPPAHGCSTASASESSKLHFLIQQWSCLAVLDKLQWPKNGNGRLFDLSLRGQIDDQRNIL